MRRFILTTAFILGLVVLTGSEASFAQDGNSGVNPDDNPRDRRAQTTMKFLDISLDARAAAMGNAMVAQEIGSSSMFYNPAGMARLGGLVSVSAGHVQWIGDFEYNQLSAAFRPAQGRYGVVGFMVRSGNYGDFIGTVRDASQSNGLRETGTFSPNTLSAGFGYAKALSDRFSVGGNLKYATQDLGATLMNQEGREVKNTESTIVADFGMLYKTGMPGLNFAAGVRNFSQEVQYADKQVELPLLLQIGLSMDMAQALRLNPNMHALSLVLDATHPRDYYTNVKFGGEYLFMNTLALRAGYAYPNGIQGANLGVGLRFDISGIELHADYAYTRFDTFSDVNRISLRLGL